MKDIHIRAESDRSRLSEACVWVNVPDDDLGCNHRSLRFQQHQIAVFKCYGCFQVIALGMSLKAVDRVSEVNIEFLSLPIEEKEYEFSNNKDFKSATTDFYTKGDHVHYQKIKWMKCSKGGRIESIAPGRIRRLRSRRNKKDNDDEDDGEDNRRRSSASDGLSFIFGIVIILMLLLILLSLIIWVMS